MTCSDCDTPIPARRLARTPLYASLCGPCEGIARALALEECTRRSYYALVSPSEDAYATAYPTVHVQVGALQEA